MASCKSKSQLKSVLTSRSNGRGRGAKITTALSPLPASPCSTNGTLSSRASVDRGLSSSSGPFFDPEPSASQGLLPPSQAMELVLKDIAKANHARRSAKRKAVYDGYTAALDEVVRRRSGRWTEEGQVRDEKWMKGVVERLGGMVSQKQEIEKRIGEVLREWEVDFEKIAEVVGMAVGLRGDGALGKEEEQSKEREKHERKKREED